MARFSLVGRETTRWNPPLCSSRIGHWRGGYSIFPIGKKMEGPSAPMRGMAVLILARCLLCLPLDMLRLHALSLGSTAVAPATRPKRGRRGAAECAPVALRREMVKLHPAADKWRRSLRTARGLLAGWNERDCGPRVCVEFLVVGRAWPLPSSSQLTICRRPSGLETGGRFVVGTSSDGSSVVVGGAAVPMPTHFPTSGLLSKLSGGGVPASDLAVACHAPVSRFQFKLLAS